jgi:hypothetical protein
MATFVNLTIIGNKVLVYSKNIILLVVLLFKTSGADGRLKVIVFRRNVKWVKSRPL